MPWWIAFTAIACVGKIVGLPLLRDISWLWITVFLWAPLVIGGAYLLLCWIVDTWRSLINMMSDGISQQEDRQAESRCIKRCVKMCKEVEGTKYEYD